MNAKKPTAGTFRIIEINGAYVVQEWHPPKIDISTVESTAAEYIPGDSGRWENVKGLVKTLAEARQIVSTAKKDKPVDRWRVVEVIKPDAV